MEERPSSFDVCIVGALSEEVRAWLEIVREQSGKAAEERVGTLHKDSYYFATLKNNKDECLNLHISHPPRYGSQEMTLHLSHMIEEYQPLIVIMIGICAGDAKRVRLGDLVVAERTYTYDNGRYTTDDDGGIVYEPDTMTDQLNPNILQFLALFDKWKPLVAGLKHPLSSSKHNDEQQPNEKRKISCHIKPMASGSAVRADKPFKEVQAPVRGTVAIDMEAAALGLVMSRYPSIRWLVVKGVCDYADNTKNDDYHDYAARASALYAFSFIQAYVTKERFPQLVPPKPIGVSKNMNVHFPHIPRLFAHMPRLDFRMRRTRSFFVKLPALFLIIILLGASGMYFLIQYMIIPAPQKVLNQFCTDLQEGRYEDINPLIEPAVLKNNGGPKSVYNGWAAMKIKTCKAGNVQKEGNTSIFTGIIIYDTTETAPGFPARSKIWIEDTQDSYKISDWGSA